MPRLPRPIRSYLVKRFDDAVQRAEDTGAGGASAVTDEEVDAVTLAFARELVQEFEDACRARSQESVVDSVAEAFGNPSLAAGGLGERLSRALRQARSNSGEGGPVFRAGVDGEWLVKRFEQVCGLTWGDPRAAAPPLPTPPPFPVVQPKLPDPATAPAGSLPYSADQAYEVGNVIFHPRFGTGKVVQVEGPRIRVMFGEQLRVLAHAMTRPTY